MSDLSAKGWLPLVLNPTDGVDRALLLPDGQEVVGAYHNPGGWRVCRVIDIEAPVYEDPPLRGGFLPMDLRPLPPEPQRKQIGTRPSKMRVYGPLPEGVYPTHFRPNDTVFGDASSRMAGV